MEVFRDSPRTDFDMGTHSRPNKAWPPLADFTGLGQGERRGGMLVREGGTGLGQVKFSDTLKILKVN